MGVTMPKCSYCGKMYDVPHGLTLVKNDGTVVYLCSAKCRKNREMGRRKVRWVEDPSKVKAKIKKKKITKKKKAKPSKKK